MNSPQIFNIPLVLVGGFILFLMITFQVLSGLRIIKTPPKYHKWAGIAIFIFGLLHAALGILYIYGG